MSSAQQLLAADGPFAAALPGFHPRPQQQAMATAVETALADKQRLVVEAGTGTGKTFAYLVPVLNSGRKVLISTASKTLQEQLCHRDLPALCRILDKPVRFCLLKGRANYVCHYRLEKELATPQKNPRVAVDLHKLWQWAQQTEEGDIAEVADVTEDSPVWRFATSTTDNCLGHECPQWKKCKVAAARERAQKADIVVINHHLYFADAALRDHAQTEILPAADGVIFDEAHQIAEIAGQFYGETVSLRQLRELVTDTRKELEDQASCKPLLDPCLDTLESRGKRLHEKIQQLPDRGNRSQLLERVTLTDLEDALAELVESLKEAAETSAGLANCFARAEELKLRLRRFLEPSSDYVQWYEWTRFNFSLARSPIDVAGILAEQFMAGDRAYVFTSATLASGEDFTYFSSQIGLQDYQSAQWESPFDYPNNSLLYVPPRMPMPDSPDYNREVLRQALPVIRYCNGRTFMLFTSHRALRETHEQLKGNCPYPLFVQGEGPKSQLIENFRHSGNGLLLGTASFWEGVDVAGEALSCVIIDRLPFASPGDPLTQARIDHLKQQGLEPFRHYQLPRAVLALKQGVGRLIRAESDRGVLMICDPRLLSRSYGRLFLRSLPSIPGTRLLSDVASFMQSQAEAMP